MLFVPFVLLLVLAAVTDIRHLIIPDCVPLLISLLSLISLAAGAPPSAASRLVGALTCGGFLAALLLLTGGVGWGDVKLMAAGGLFLGAERAFPALLSAYFMAALWCIPLLLCRRARRDSAIPMAPFFGLSLLLWGLWGGRLLAWYFGPFSGPPVS